MLARLGNVLYWLGCIVAVLIAAAGFMPYWSEGYARKDGVGVTIASVVIALIAWVVGRACRYVLAGK